MSFHELLASYPWTVKRAIRVLDESPQMPRRNPFAYVVALFVPYAGRRGAGMGLLLYVYFVGILAGIGIPAYRTHVARVAFESAIVESQRARDSLGRYYETSKQVPQSLDAAGIAASLPNGIELGLQPKGMILTVQSKFGVLLFVPKLDDTGHVIWICHGGQGITVANLPPSCR